MKASELIECLQGIIKQYGDVVVYGEERDYPESEITKETIEFRREQKIKLYSGNYYLPDRVVL